MSGSSTERKGERDGGPCTLLPFSDILFWTSGKTKTKKHSGKILLLRDSLVSLTRHSTTRALIYPGGSRHSTNTWRNAPRGIMGPTVEWMGWDNGWGMGDADDSHHFLPRPFRQNGRTGKKPGTPFQIRSTGYRHVPRFIELATRSLEGAFYPRIFCSGSLNFKRCFVLLSLDLPSFL